MVNDIRFMQMVSQFTKSPLVSMHFLDVYSLLGTLPVFLSKFLINCFASSVPIALSSFLVLISTKKLYTLKCVLYSTSQLQQICKQHGGRRAAVRAQKTSELLPYHMGYLFSKFVGIGSLIYCEACKHWTSVDHMQQNSQKTIQIQPKMKY